MKNITINFGGKALGLFFDKLAATTKLARKYGLPEPVVDFCGTYDRSCYEKSSELLSLHPPQAHWVETWYEVSIAVPERYAYGEYDVVAVKDLRNAEVSVFSKDQIPTSFIDAENYCEHCESHRNRKNIFLIRDRSKDIYIQLGGDCTKHYTGRSPEQLLTIFERISDISTSLEHFDSQGGGWRRPVYHTYPLVKVMSILLNDLHLSYSDAKFHISAYLCDCGNPHHCGDVSSRTGEIFSSLDDHDGTYADKVYEWMKSVEYDEDGKLNGYLYAVYQAATTEITTKSGIPGSAVYIYKRDHDSENKDAKNEYFGTVGERSEFTLTCDDYRIFENAYGESTLFKFHDSEGRTFKIWNSTGKKEK
jgi:hypothetical protein